MIAHPFKGEQDHMIRLVGFSSLSGSVENAYVDDETQTDRQKNWPVKKKGRRRHWTTCFLNDVPVDGIR